MFVPSLALSHAYDPVPLLSYLITISRCCCRPLALTPLRFQPTAPPPPMQALLAQESSHGSMEVPAEPVLHAWNGITHELAKRASMQQHNRR